MAFVSSEKSGETFPMGTCFISSNGKYDTSPARLRHSDFDNMSLKSLW